MNEGLTLLIAIS